MTTRQRAFHYCEDTAAIPALLRGAVVAIGNFDGFHRGHQRVMRTLLGMAKQRNRPAIVLTFEPHPRDFFALGEPLFRLTDRTSKRMLAKAMGLDGLVVLDFDQALSEIEPEDFVRRILVENLACSSVVVGENFRFGRQRRGDIGLLQRMGVEHGYAVEGVLLERDCHDVVSSTRIRAALANGDVDAANHMLGFSWFVDATPVDTDPGQQRFACARLEKMPEGRYYVRGAAGPWPIEGIVNVSGHQPGIIDAILPDIPRNQALRFSVLGRAGLAFRSLESASGRSADANPTITNLDRALGLV